MILYDVFFPEIEEESTAYCGEREDSDLCQSSTLFDHPYSYITSPRSPSEPTYPLWEPECHTLHKSEFLTASVFMSGISHCHLSTNTLELIHWVGLSAYHKSSNIYAVPCSISEEDYSSFYEYHTIMTKSESVYDEVSLSPTGNVALKTLAVTTDFCHFYDTMSYISLDCLQSHCSSVCQLSGMSHDSEPDAVLDFTLFPPAQCMAVLLVQLTLLEASSSVKTLVILMEHVSLSGQNKLLT